MFTEKELREIEGFKRGSDFIEVKCGCTSKKCGDTIGKLKVSTNGKFLISCQCTPARDEENLTPYDFEKHSGKEGTRKWKNHIWVVMKNKKVHLWRTILLKYYKHASNGANELSTLQSKRLFHRDEFICCSRRKNNAGFVSGLMRNAEFTMMLRMQGGGGVITGHMTKSPAQMMKSEQVGKAAEAVLDLRPAKVALLVCVSGASSAASWTAGVALALISCKMQNLELGTKHPFCAALLQLSFHNQRRKMIN